MPRRRYSNGAAASQRGVAMLFDRPAAQLRPVPSPVLVNPSLTLESLDLDHLALHGFCKPPGQFLTDSGLEFCRENIDRMIGDLAASQPDRTPDRMVSQHQCGGGEWLWDLISNPLLVAAAQRQIGGDVLCWSTHLLIKEPGTGAAIPWCDFRLVFYHFSAVCSTDLGLL